MTEGIIEIATERKTSDNVISITKEYLLEIKSEFPVMGVTDPETEMIVLMVSKDYAAVMADMANQINQEFVNDRKNNVEVN